MDVNINPNILDSLNDIEKNLEEKDQKEWLNVEQSKRVELESKVLPVAETPNEISALGLDQPIVYSEGELEQGEAQAKMESKNCPTCKADLTLDNALRVVKTGRAIQMQQKGKKMRAVSSFCNKCGTSLGFAGLVPIASAYPKSPKADRKKKESRRREKLARKRNR